jgi:preprotein translocase subunit SecE
MTISFSRRALLHGVVVVIIIIVVVVVVIWGPPSLLSNGYQWLFPWGKAAGT